MAPVVEPRLPICPLSGPGGSIQNAKACMDTPLNTQTFEDMMPGARVRSFLGSSLVAVRLFELSHLRSPAISLCPVLEVWTVVHHRSVAPGSSADQVPTVGEPQHTWATRRTAEAAAESCCCCCRHTCPCVTAGETPKERSLGLVLSTEDRQTFHGPCHETRPRCGLDPVSLCSRNAGSCGPTGKSSIVPSSHFATR